MFYVKDNYNITDFNNSINRYSLSFSISTKSTSSFIETNFYIYKLLNILNLRIKYSQNFQTFNSLSLSLSLSLLLQIHLPFIETIFLYLQIIRYFKFISTIFPEFSKLPFLRNSPNFLSFYRNFQTSITELPS